MPWPIRTTVTLLALLAAQPAGAQRLATTAIGARVRLMTCAGTSIAGKFGGVRRDSVDIVIDSVVTSTVSFPPDRIPVARSVAFDCIKTYSVFQRYGNRAGTGALVGGGLGLLVVGAAWAGDRAYDRHGGAATIPGIALAVPLALAFTGIGALIGAASGPEQWSVPSSMAASVRSTPRGTQSALAYRF